MFRTFLIIIGGIKGFSSNQMNVLKWCLNRPKQAEIMRDLTDFAGLSQSKQDCKVLRRREIEKSEAFVQTIITILEDNYINPFGIEVDKEGLFNLSSGLEYDGDAEKVLGIRETGLKLYDDFKKERLHSTKTGFHESIKQQKPVLFSSSKRKKAKKNGKYEVVEANRSVLEKLLTISSNAKEPIDFNRALEFPLYHLPLSLAHPDGKIRSTSKSKLLEIVLPSNSTTMSSLERSASNLVIDMIAHYRVISKTLPETFEDWILRFLNTLPKNYSRVDIVADTYRDFSIKSGERLKRGSGSRLLIKSMKCKTPQDIGKFFTNNENKSRLINLTFEFIKENPQKCLGLLGCNVITLSSDTYCVTVTANGNVHNDDLKSDQEEADTKVVLHALDILASSPGNVCIRSPSGDTDILVVALGVIVERSRVKLDYGNGSNRKHVWLDCISLPVDQRQALIGFHAFTGNDYVSAFFRKGKSACWKTMLKDNRFVEMFTQLGNAWELSSPLKKLLENYVCKLYGSKKLNVNSTRFELFERKQRKGVIVDLSVIPPCLSSLLLHMERANYVARLWKLSGVPMLNDAPSPIGYGWDQDGDVVWIDEMLPEDVKTLFVQDEDSSESENDDDTSDSENDNDSSESENEDIEYGEEEGRNGDESDKSDSDDEEEDILTF